MATRYYIVGGAYYTWDQLHNQFGYTDHETANISYKSAHPTTWGESAGSGYFDGDQTDMVNGSFWSDEDPTAWFDLSGLVYNAEVYPADAIDCAMEKDGVRSDAVSIESDGVTYYLIRNVWDSGWMSESEAAAEGWEPAQPGPVLPVVYAHTGTQTAASIAPDASFDTGLTYDSNNLYIGETDDGLGDVTRYGWEAEEGPEPPAYTEITLYMQSGSKRAQKQVTSGFTGNVNATYCYQLYTDEQLTTPWTGYDYSNEYVIVTAQGIPFSIQKVSDLPDTYTSDSTQWKMAFILMDNGFLWLASNVSGSGYMSYPSEFITVRIYPKGQQWIPAFPYNPSYGKYDNLSINRKGTFVRMGSSATVFGTFPAIAESFGYKSGMIKSASIQAEFLISQATLYLNVVGNPSLSNIVVRFENDICTGYVRSDKADLPTSPSYDGATYTLKDDNGNNIDYDDSFTYKFVLLLNSAGEAVGGTYATGSMIESSTGKLQVRIRYSSSKFNRVWYYRIPIL